jgi:hypothetical protein
MERTSFSDRGLQQLRFCKEMNEEEEYFYGFFKAFISQKLRFCNPLFLGLRDRNSTPPPKTLFWGGGGKCIRFEDKNL